MPVEIGTIDTEVHAVDGESLLSPQLLKRITREVLAALQEHQEHQQRVRSEQRITLGVRHEQEEF